jgi:hypothetical protein
MARLLNIVASRFIYFCQILATARIAELRRIIMLLFVHNDRFASPYLDISMDGVRVPK